MFRSKAPGKNKELGCRVWVMLQEATNNYQIIVIIYMYICIYAYIYVYIYMYIYMYI